MENRPSTNASDYIKAVWNGDQEPLEQLHSYIEVLENAKSQFEAENKENNSSLENKVKAYSTFEHQNDSKAIRELTPMYNILKEGYEKMQDENRWAFNWVLNKTDNLLREYGEVFSKAQKFKLDFESLIDALNARHEEKSKTCFECMNKFSEAAELYKINHFDSKWELKEDNEAQVGARLDYVLRSLKEEYESKIEKECQTVHKRLMSTTKNLETRIPLKDSDENETIKLSTQEYAENDIFSGEVSEQELKYKAGLYANELDKFKKIGESRIGIVNDALASLQVQLENKHKHYETLIDTFKQCRVFNSLANDYIPKNEAVAAIKSEFIDNLNKIQASTKANIESNPVYQNFPELYRKYKDSNCLAGKGFDAVLKSMRAA